MESRMRRQGEIVEGQVITATRFEGDINRPFKIKLLSTNTIAEGSSAIVLKGRVNLVDKTSIVVALKVFRLPLNTDQRELFHTFYRKELEAAKRLGAAKDYILPFLGTAELAFQPVLVTQYMQNGNILEYIDRLRPYKVNRLQLLIEVANALNFLHTKTGLVHGDIKSENILIADGGKPLLADFGLSALIEKAESSATTALSVRGWNSVRFAAPELLEDTASSGSTARVRSKTTQSDVWAFGMLMIQVFTGRPPWPGCDSTVVVHKTLISGESHPRPGEEATSLGLSDRLWGIFLECTTRELASRPSMSSVVTALHIFASTAHSWGSQAEARL
ncbi:kinase-like protein [Auricularia subglabra TFB-10046 SS5]|uniref:Kinase-like protein n=1 Tax=Auricularia subglabra (strain TFB-10046 / SS5) TaxID=717982 RepID=J0WVI5_AURST|nr:kinase-like protein [Auricularia subglabra TFB-10046 SS5]